MDNHGRPIRYLRIAVTDRCNLRCAYCMPEQMRFLPAKELLSDEEIVRLVGICASLGVRKVRVTGGEPFARRGIMEILREITRASGVEETHITTNGALLGSRASELVSCGVRSVNLSVDAFERARFFELTRRDEYEAVEAAFFALLESGIPLNVNAVVMDGKNDRDIIPMCEKTKDHAFSMRFIEEMPFNGATLAAGESPKALRWNYAAILNEIRSAFPDIQPLGRAHKSATSELYHIPGHKGTIGIIAGYSRTFCGACSRIRITAKGMLKTCLYDNGVLDLKALLRSGASDDEARAAIADCVQRRFANGWEAEKFTFRLRSVSPHSNTPFDSMSEIGG